MTEYLNPLNRANNYTYNRPTTLSSNDNNLNPKRPSTDPSSPQSLVFGMHPLPSDGREATPDSEMPPECESTNIPRATSHSNNEQPYEYNTLDFKRDHHDPDKIINKDDADVLTNRDVPDKDKDVGDKFSGGRPESSSRRQPQAEIDDHFDDFDDIMSNIDSEISTLQRGLVLENPSIAKRGPPPPLPPKPRPGSLARASLSLHRESDDVIVNPSVTTATNL